MRTCTHQTNGRPVQWVARETRTPVGVFEHELQCELLSIRWQVELPIVVPELHLAQAAAHPRHPTPRRACFNPAVERRQAQQVWVELASARA